MLCREYTEGKFSLDYNIDGYSTRIANDIDKNIYFDKEFKNIVFRKNNKLCVLKDDVITEVGECPGITAVTLISAK